jgi:hypothetical protein
MKTEADDFKSIIPISDNGGSREVELHFESEEQNQ